MRDWRRPRYSVRTLPEGWWLYDWKQYKSVQVFPMSEKAQADAVCKLMNSINEEGT